MRLFDYINQFDERVNFNNLDIPVIIADDIAKQIDALNGDEPHKAEDFGVIAPPFKLFFIEAKTKTLDQKAVIRRGAMVESVDYYIEKLPEGTNHIMKFQGWWMLDDSLLRIKPVIYIHCDNEGYMLDDMEKLLVAFGEGDSQNDLIDEQQANTILNMIPFSLKAINALHKRAPVEKVTPKRGERRRWQKKHGKDAKLTDYYVLKVRPTKNNTDFEEVGQPAQAKRREHIVRGHFRYYKQDAPLFGKISGAVWIPDHSRGNETIGTIKKDYEVE